MQSSSDCILRRPPADKRRLQTTQLLFSCSKSDPCSSSSRFPWRGCSLNAREQNSPFWQWHQRRRLAFVLEAEHVWSELQAVKWSAKFLAAALWGWLSAAIRADLLKQLSVWHAHNHLPFFTFWRLNRLWHLNTWRASGVHSLLLILDGVLKII